MKGIARVIGRLIAVLADRGVLERDDCVWILEPLKEAEKESEVKPNE